MTLPFKVDAFAFASQLTPLIALVALLVLLVLGHLEHRLVRAQRTAPATVRTQVHSIRDKTGTSSIRALIQFVATLPVPMLGMLRDTQNYVQLAAHGLTLWDVAPSRVERDLEQWQPLSAWLGA